MTTTLDPAQGKPVLDLTARDFKGPVDPDWCPGCGDFGVLNSLQRACAELGLKPHEITGGQRHRLLLQLARLFQRLRDAHAPRAVLAP